MALKLVTAPAEEPITTVEAKSHLRVDSSDDDTLIDGCIVVARQAAEYFSRRALVTQTWDYVLDAFPSEGQIRIPLPPLQSITSITYTDKDGNVSTFDASNYVVDTDSEPGRVALKSGVSWPSATLYPVAAVKIRFVAGYGDKEDVPQIFKQAIKLYVGHLYENREAVLIGTSSRELPLGISSLLWHVRIAGPSVLRES